ncbi:dienelactone hydrolase family protein [Tropicimonas sp.]|uniref:dienelactone hydrolase family protein n=1 Tax=Tropicimonas sp. TaxID=2067044 RepID=UPI003A851C3B
MMIWIAAGILVAVGVAALVGCNTYLRYQGRTVARVEPQTLAGMLRPGYRVRLPDGDGPFPTALLFSGCDGPKDSLDFWSDTLNAMGWGTVVVDSHGPRGYDRAQIWRLICVGQLLTGGERAGDIAVAIDDVRAMPGVDPDNLVLIGASHGGWSILDLLSLRDRGRLPFNLSRWPDSIAARGLEGVRGMILLYPYCGMGSQVSRHGWAEDIPALFLLVEGDSIADEDSCKGVAGRMRQSGKDIEVHVLRDATHGFDQKEKNFMSTLEFSPEATAEAVGYARRFLDRVVEGH